MEVLRHHDLGQAGVAPFAGLHHVLRPLQQLRHGLGQAGHGGDGAGELAPALDDQGLLDLGRLHVVEHLFRRLAGQPRDVGQAALRVGQLVDRALELVGVAQLLQGVVQLARDVAELLEHLRVAGGLFGNAVCHGMSPTAAYRPSFLKMLASFSSSVALVKGLTM
ncbi:hypothetical protein D9M68_816750 [compost metagenome]